MSPAGVSVVVPHYGSPALAEALTSTLLAQPTDVPLQVVVVDDCSPEPFPDRPGVEVVRREHNGGFGSAVNSGAAVARHPLLLVLNSDLTLPERFLDELVAAAAPLMPAVVSPRVVTGDRAVAVGRRFPTAHFQAVEWTTLFSRFRYDAWFRRAIGELPVPAEDETLPADWVAGMALLLPTDVFRRVGGFDESFFMYAEEVDLQRRLRDVGVPSWQVGAVTVGHAQGGSSDPLRARSWQTTSRLHYAEKWAGRGGGRRRLVAALTLATGVNLVVNATRRALGRDVDPLGTARQEWRLVRGSRIDG